MPHVPHSPDYTHDVQVDCVLPRIHVHDAADLWARLANALARACGCPAHSLRTRLQHAAQDMAHICMGDGVAAVHITSPSIAVERASLAVLFAPLDMGAPDGASVEVLYVLLTPPTGAEGTALRRIARITRVLKDPNLRARLAAETDATAAAALVNGQGAQSWMAAA